MDHSRTTGDGGNALAGPARWIALGGLGATVAIAALAWAARRSGHTLRVQP